MSSSVVGVLLRLTNVIIALFGVALLVFGIYMTVEVKGFSTVPVLVLCLGTIDTLFGLIIVTCGFKSIFVLRLYMLILGLCVICYGSCGVRGTTHSTQTWGVLATEAMSHPRTPHPTPTRQLNPSQRGARADRSCYLLPSAVNARQDSSESEST